MFVILYDPDLLSVDRFFLALVLVVERCLLYSALCVVRERFFRRRILKLFFERIDEENFMKFVTFFLMRLCLKALRNHTALNFVVRMYISLRLRRTQFRSLCETVLRLRFSLLRAWIGLWRRVSSLVSEEPSFVGLCVLRV